MATLAARSSLQIHNDSRNGTSHILQFTPGGTFQITVFSDLHGAENEKKDTQTASVLSNILKYERSQLIVLNGDLITTDAIKSHSNSTNYLDRLVAPIVSADLPWAATYGNHDCHPRFGPDYVFRQEKKYKNSLTQTMLASKRDVGVTNYYLPVYSSSGSREVPALILWFFDSKGGYRFTEGGSKERRPDWVHDEVTEWFHKTRTHLRQTHGKVIPSLAFFHIPLNSTRAFQTQGVDPNRQPGRNLESVKQQGRQWGGKYKEWDVPFMKELLDTEGLLATFSGHDHENDWCFKWNGTIANTTLPGDGINICYGRHSGYGGYGDLKRGARQILLREDTMEEEVRTWIRLEDKRVTGNITLNSTYGMDKYPEVGAEVDLGIGLVPFVHSAIPLLFLVFYLPLMLWN